MKKVLIVKQILLLSTFMHVHTLGVHYVVQGFTAQLVSTVIL